MKQTKAMIIARQQTRLEFQALYIRKLERMLRAACSMLECTQVPCTVDGWFTTIPAIETASGEVRRWRRLDKEERFPYGGSASTRWTGGQAPRSSIPKNVIIDKRGSK